MISIVIAIVGLGLLVVLHEGGHFVAARLCGMRVERFSIGFGPTLLCSLAAFVDPDGRRLGLVYRFKQGTFYPFAPAVGPGTTLDGAAVQRRDNLLEIQVRDLLRSDLRVEPETSRWFAVWGAPGL